MRELFTNRRLIIPSGRAVSGIANRAHRVRIKSGRVWITVEGVLHDYWLFAGESFTLTPGALTVMEADGAASSLELASEDKGSVLAQLHARLRYLARLVQRFGRNRSRGARGACQTC